MASSQAMLGKARPRYWTRKRKRKSKRNGKKMKRMVNVSSKTLGAMREIKQTTIMVKSGSYILRRRPTHPVDGYYTDFRNPPTRRELKLLWMYASTYRKEKPPQSIVRVATCEMAAREGNGTGRLWLFFPCVLRGRGRADRSKDRKYGRGTRGTFLRRLPSSLQGVNVSSQILTYSLQTFTLTQDLFTYCHLPNHAPHPAYLAPP